MVLGRLEKIVGKLLKEKWRTHQKPQLGCFVNFEFM